MMAKQLKKQMEREWNENPCAFPLRLATWMISGKSLLPNHNPGVPDEDESGPFSAQ